MDRRKGPALALTLALGLLAGDGASARQSHDARQAHITAWPPHAPAERMVECNAHECCIYQDGKFVTCM